MNPRFLLLTAIIGTTVAAWAADLQPTTLPIGASAPDFTLTGVDDRPHSLKDYAEAKFLAIVFICNHCPTAQAYEERIKAIVTDYAPKGLKVVAINPNDPKALRLDELGWSDMSDTFAEMKIRARDHRFNFPYLYDGDNQVVAHAYGPVATPHIFIFDEQRKLRYVGAIDDSERIQKVTKTYARDALDALVAGKEPPVTKTKVPGCSVKWSAKVELAQAFLEQLNKQPVALTLVDTNGLRELRQNKSGKCRLINFWATWCGPCVAEYPELVAISRIYQRRELEFVSVSINQPDEQKSVLAFLTKNHSANQNLLFGSSTREPLINAFDPEWQGEVPYTVLLSDEGKVLYREAGTLDLLALKRAIVAGLNALESQ